MPQHVTDLWSQCNWILRLVVLGAVACSSPRIAFGAVDIEQELKRSYKSGHEVGFMISVNKDAPYSPTSRKDRGVVNEYLVLNAEKVEGRNGLYVVQPVWEGKWFFDKQSGVVMWKEHPDPSSIYSFYLFVPDSPWDSSDDSIRIYTRDNMNSFALSEFRIDIRLKRGGVTKPHRSFDPGNLDADPLCGSMWIRTTNDLMANEVGRIHDVLLLRTSKQCFSDRDSLDDRRYFVAAVLLEGFADAQFEIAEIWSDGTRLSEDSAKLEAFLSGGGFFQDSAGEQPNLLLLSGTIGKGQDSVEVTVKLTGCEKSIRQMISVQPIEGRKPTPGDIRKTQRATKISMSQCLQAAPLKLSILDVPTGTKFSWENVTKGEQDEFIKQINTQTWHISGKILSKVGVALIIERDGFERYKFPLSSVDFSPPGYRLPFPKLTLSAREVALYVEEFSMPLTAQLGKSKLEFVRNMGATFVYKVPPEPEYTLDEQQTLSVWMPEGLHLVEAPSGWVLAEDKRRIYKGIFRDDLPLHSEEGALPKDSKIFATPLEFERISLAGRKTSVKTPLVTRRGSIEAHQIFCQPGVRDETDTYWLTKSQRHWVFPDKLNSLDYDADLAIVSRAVESSHGTSSIACDENETLLRVKAVDITTHGITLPLARPVLVYILRDRNEDARVGARSADLFWDSLLSRVETALKHRIYVVRVRSDAATGFKTLRAPTEFLAREDFDKARLIEESGRSSDAPSLKQVAKDAHTLIKNLGRDQTKLSADVLILASNLPGCGSVEKQLADLAEPNGKAKARVLVLADSTWGSTLLKGSEGAISVVCEPKTTGLEILFTNAEKAAIRRVQLFPQEQWAKALSELK